MGIKGMDMEPIRILLADDHTIVRDGLRAILEREPDMAVIAEAADGRECIRLAESSTPDVVVMDLGMPNMNGMEATRRIVSANPRIGIVILSMHQDESYVLGALKAGAKGYLLKDSMRGEVLQAIRAVYHGRSFLTRKVAQMLQEDYVSRLEERGLEDRYDLLSDREREVLQFIVEGRSNKEVANLLNISLTTVETHRGHILQKLDIHSVPELILYAVRKGIIS
jgi:DNA-binding NarL/FixJ family response regulator